MTHRIIFTLIATVCALTTTACSSLPESGSQDAKLYAARCGACHKPPEPKENHVFQWERLITMMDRRILHTGMTPLTPQERDTLIAYLTRHAMPNPIESTQPSFRSPSQTRERQAP